MLAAAVAQPFQLTPTLCAKASRLGADFAAAGASGRQRKIEQQISKPPDRTQYCACHPPLSREAGRRTSGAVPPDLFDRQLRALRRDRAARTGPELFLLDRAFDECLDRLRDLPRHFDRALLVGCPSAEWRSRLSAVVRTIDAVDPGPLFAAEADGLQIEEDRHDFGADQYDLCLAIGTLDSVNDLALALRLIGRALKRDAPLIGAIAGGNSLPALRAALIEAGRHEGRIVARTHPRIDPGTLAQLLASADLGMPVVDVDRVRLRYADFDALVRDLRLMGATSVLGHRSPPVSKVELQLIRQAFAAQGSDGRTEEIVEILHFLAWSK
jgi:SAM-dependent methyltransferase